MRGVKRSATPRPFIPVVFIVAAPILAAGCVYFNALYNANRLFDQGRTEIEDGFESRGRATLRQSIEKAERVVQSNPESRWADDALTLVVRARLLREEWPEAADASRRLFAYARTDRDSARVAGYLGIAEFKLGHPALADSLLTVGLSVEENDEARARLLANRAQSRERLGHIEEADEDFRAASELRSRWVDPRLERARMLVDNDRGSEAALELSNVLNMGVRGVEEDEVMEAVEYLVLGDPSAASGALAAVESSELSFPNRATLVRWRGDIRLAEGQPEKARADYELSIRLAPQSRNIVASHLSLVGLDLRVVSTIDELGSVMVRIDEASALPPGPGSVEINDLRNAADRIVYWVDLGNLGYLAAAEAARDRLEARQLARRLFLEYAQVQPEALWAAKAILAALDLTGVDSARQGEMKPEVSSREALRQRLLDDYSHSAYVQVFVGGSGAEFTYEELEAGLRRQLQRLDVLADQAVRGARAPTNRP